MTCRENRVREANMEGAVSCIQNLSSNDLAGAKEVLPSLKLLYRSPAGAGEAREVEALISINPRTGMRILNQYLKRMTRE